MNQKKHSPSEPVKTVTDAFGRVSYRDNDMAKTPVLASQIARTDGGMLVTRSGRYRDPATTLVI